MQPLRQKSRNGICGRKDTVAPFFLGGFAILIAGCGPLLAKQLPVEQVALTELPRPEVYMKGNIQRLSPDGNTVEGVYFTADARFRFRFIEGPKLKATLIPGSQKMYTDAEEQLVLSKQPRLEAWTREHISEAKQMARKINPRYKEDQADLVARDMTPDGSIVVGEIRATRDSRDQHPFIWREDIGFVDLNTWVKNVPSARGKSWTLGHVDAVSADGTALGLSYCESTPPGGSGMIVIRNASGFGKAGKLSGIDFGELQITGVVKTLRPGKWEVSASSITTTDGKVTPLSPARNKVVILPKGLMMGSSLKAGSRVIITGRDGGQGKPLTARTIVTETSRTNTSIGKPQ